MLPLSTVQTSILDTIALHCHSFLFTVAVAQLESQNPVQRLALPGVPTTCQWNK